MSITSVNAYRSHLGDIFFTDESLSFDDLYCDTCEDSDELICVVDDVDSLAFAATTDINDFLGTDPESLMARASLDINPDDYMKNIVPIVWRSFETYSNDLGITLNDFRIALESRLRVSGRVSGFDPFNWNRAYRYLLAHDPLESIIHNGDDDRYLRILAQSPYDGALMLPLGLMSAFTSAMETLHPGFLVLFREALEHYHGHVLSVPGTSDRMLESGDEDAYDKWWAKLELE